MAVVMDVDIDVGLFQFAELFERLPELRIEIERVVPIQSEMPPFLWVWGEGRDAFETVVTEVTPIVDLECIFEDEDASLYRVFWTSDSRLFGPILVDGMVVTRASCTATGWRLSLQFDDRADVREFRARCADHSVEFSLGRVTDLAEWQANRYNLTTAQRDTLVRAFESGYFREPRETTVEALAAEFGISARAMSGRLRRGTERLLASTLAVESTAAE